MKESKFELCDKCGGKGKLDWTDRDAGVCYGCEGKGYKGPQNDEFDAEIKRRKKRRDDFNRLYKIIDNISKAIYPSPFGASKLEDLAYMSLTDPNSKIKPVSKWKLSKEAADFFETPYVLDYTKALNVNNPSAHTIKMQKALNGKKATISKIAPNAVQVDLGIQ